MPLDGRSPLWASTSPGCTRPLPNGLGRTLATTDPPVIADYQATVGARLERTAGFSGRQPGDPARAAEAMIAVVEAPDPPGISSWEPLPLKEFETSSRQRGGNRRVVRDESGADFT